MIKRLVCIVVVVSKGVVGQRSKRSTFCATGHPASTGDYDICCAKSCGVCAEPSCRERPGGPLNCCPLSGILASRETCRARRDESCALRRPSWESSKIFGKFIKGNTTAGHGRVHVAITGDHLHYVGLVAAASSIFSTTTTPDRIKLHIIAEKGPELIQLRAALECTLGESRKSAVRRQHPQKTTDDDADLLNDEDTNDAYDDDDAAFPTTKNKLMTTQPKNTSVLTGNSDTKKLLWWDIVIFEADKHMPRNLTIVAPNNEQKGNLAADLNYARFYLPDLLPAVDKVIYLDADTIVAKDICKLFDTALIDETPLPETHRYHNGWDGGGYIVTHPQQKRHLLTTENETKPVIAAVSRDFKSVCFSLIYCDDPRVMEFLQKNGIDDPERDLNFFNAGVIVFDLKRWKMKNLTRRAEFWMAANAELAIYSLGSNPPLLLAVGTHFESIDPKWNCDGFGFKRPSSVTHECQTDAGIRHWSGHLKPWRRDGKYKMFWYPYITDLNCMLLLDHSPLRYPPPPELPLRQRAVVDSTRPLPSVDHLPTDFLLQLTHSAVIDGIIPQDQLEGLSAAALAELQKHAAAASEALVKATTSRESEEKALYDAAKKSSTSSKQSKVSSSSSSKSKSSTDKQSSSTKKSSSSQSHDETTIKSSSGDSTSAGKSSNRKKYDLSTTDAERNRQEEAKKEDWVSLASSQERAATVSGNTAQHRSREAEGLYAVMDMMHTSLGRYKSLRKRSSVRGFVESLRNHPSVKWARPPQVHGLRSKRGPNNVHCDAVDHVVVIIHNNSLYVDSRQYGPRSPCGPRPPEAAMGTFKFLHSMRETVRLPDTIFILCLDPRGTRHSDVPIFTYGKANGYAQPGILVPNPYFGRSHIRRWERISKQFEEAAQRHPWGDRLPRVLWRGPFATQQGQNSAVPPTLAAASTLFGVPDDENPLTSSIVASTSVKGSESTISTTDNRHTTPRLCNDEANVARLDAVALTYTQPELFDMRIADGLRDAPSIFKSNCKPPRSVPAEIRSYLSRPESTETSESTDSLRLLFSAKWSGRISSMAFKFVSTLPEAGGAPPQTRNEIWLLGSAVLIWHSSAVEWYYPALNDGVTHLTIDRHTAIDVVRDLVKDDNRAQRLAIEATGVYDNHLCPSCIMEFWVELLDRYNRRFGLRDVNIPAIVRDLDTHRRLTPIFFP